MKNFILLLILTASVFTASANKIEARLLGESQDGKTVKLMWFLKKWDKDLIGFNIKRKDQHNNWITINDELIVPEISIDRNLQNVENSTIELLRLKSKLKGLLDEGTLKPASNQDLANSLLQNTDTMKIMTQSFGKDFDLALLTGFGITDRNVNVEVEQYALFLVRNKQGEDKTPTATFVWSTGTKTNLSPDIKIKSTHTGQGTQLLWSLPFNSMETVHAAGFNIYKKVNKAWVKINDHPVTKFNNIKNGYTFYDKNSKGDITYAVSLASIFNNEGKKTEYLVRNSNNYTNNYVAENLSTKSQKSISL